jgi:hypothetical protein
MSENNFTSNLGTHEMSCGPPGCICIQLGQDQNEADCRCIGDIYKTTPDSSREVSEMDEFIDKAKQNINTVFAEYEDKLVVIDGEDKKEQCIFNSKAKSKSLRR